MTPEPDKSPRRRQTEAALMRAMMAVQASGLAFGEIVIEGATIRILPKAETAPKDSARKPQAW